MWRRRLIRFGRNFAIVCVLNMRENKDLWYYSQIVQMSAYSALLDLVFASFVTTFLDLPMSNAQQYQEDKVKKACSHEGCTGQSLIVGAPFIVALTHSKCQISCSQPLDLL